MLSLLCLRRPALFIKANDGYLSQRCQIHPVSIPPSFPYIPSQISFFFPPMSTTPLQCSPQSTLLLVFNPSIRLSFPSTIKPSNPSSFFLSLSLCVCATFFLSRQMKQEKFKFITVITCHTNQPLSFLPCGCRAVLLAFFWKVYLHICFPFVSFDELFTIEWNDSGDH